jgi:hypothetical protein
MIVIGYLRLYERDRNNNDNIFGCERNRQRERENGLSLLDSFHTRISLFTDSVIQTKNNGLLFSTNENIPEENISNRPRQRRDVV